MTHTCTLESLLPGLGQQLPIPWVRSPITALSHHAGSIALWIYRRNLARGQGDPERKDMEGAYGEGQDIHVDVRKALRRDVQETGKIQVSIDSVGFVATKLALTG